MKIAVMASGTGSLLQAIISDGVPLELVIVDRPCRAKEIAESAGIPVEMVRRRDFGYYQDAGDNWDREGHTREVMNLLLLYQIDVVAMAGFFTILHPCFFGIFGGRTLNSHPALLPNFRGATAVADTLTAGVKHTGTTIHIATEVLDDDRFIVRQQGGIPVLPDDTEDTLWERIKGVERKLYPEVLWGIIRGEINLKEVMAQ